MNLNTGSARPQILVADGDSQYTLKIESSLRELGYRCAVFKPEAACKWLTANPVRGIILSGGPQSVNDADAVPIPQAFFDAGVPILAICYGMQDVAKRFGGEVAAIESQRGYSREMLEFDTTVNLFKEMPNRQVVWASHGDSVLRIPDGFSVIARNPSTDGIAALVGVNFDVATAPPIWCVQFHPEVPQTRYGKVMLKNFTLKICGIEQDWKPMNMVRKMRAESLAALGDRIAFIGASGGVDSTTAIALLAPVLGERLHAVLIDGGQLREGEVEEARENVEAAGATLVVIDAKKRFAKAFGNTLDAEKVRAVFRKLYAEILMREARRFSRGDMRRVVLIQGTLAPDRIESAATGAALIKTHHNVNLDTGRLEQLHPLANLFKYEVRALARRLGLPRNISERHPFPGPGNFIRLPGLPKTPENLAVVAWAEARTREVLERHGWYRRISQLVVAYGFNKTVGVKGDARVYEPVAVIRAVRTIDFMTAEGVIFPPQIWREIVIELARHPKISRVLLDSTNKPPGTTEFE
ncbi:MAG: glutamine-hydrolyzing GMP synthase [bacterium]|nr:glutamine-hydrolyzing GMP synthase [bacterium]